MSHMLSDEDSTDSDSGIRFKTENTRKPTNYVTSRGNKSLSNRRNFDVKHYDSYSSSHSKHRDRSRDRRYSRDVKHKRSRSKELDRYKSSSSREQSSHKNSRSRERSTHTNRIKYNSEKSREYKNDNSSYGAKSRDSKTRRKTDETSRERRTSDSSKQIIISKRIRKNSELVSNSEDQSRSNQSSSHSKTSQIVSKKSKSGSESPISNSSNQFYGPRSPVKNKNGSNNLKLSSESTKKINNEATKLEDKSKNKTERSSTENHDGYGLDLPKNLEKFKHVVVNEQDSKIKEDASTYGPILPPKINKNTLENTNVGPILTSKKSKSDTSSIDMYGLIVPGSSKKEDSSEDEDQNSYGPALPIQLSKNKNEEKKPNDKDSNKIIGPSLPPHLREKLILESETHPHNLNNETNISQEIQEEESDDDMIGPLPEGHGSKNISHKLLEERALEIRINALNPIDTAPRREEWMTALPDVHRVNLGLGPRQFRTKAGPDLSDRSSWTDTPEDKEKKEKKEVKIDIKEKSKLEHIAKRDKEQEEIVKKHKKKKKRDKALIELHQEKLAKKKKEESNKTQERRPFDRDVDLKVNRFDEAQKKAILKKAQLLDTRFSTGESKFL